MRAFCAEVVLSPCHGEDGDADAVSDEPVFDCRGCPRVPLDLLGRTEP